MASMRSGLAVVSALVLCAVVRPAGGQATEGDAASSRPPGVLYLRAGTIDLKRLLNALTSGVAFDPRVRYVIQLDGPITPGRRQALTATGVELGAYLPSNAYVARLGGVNAESLRGLGFITWVGPYQGDWKICPSIRRPGAGIDSRPTGASGEQKLVVALFPDANVATASRAVKACGASVKARSEAGMPGEARHPDAVLTDARNPAARRALDVAATGQAVDRLRELADVMFVEEAFEGEPRNATTTWICQSNVTDFTPLWNAGLHGEGQMAGIVDWAMRADHCSFADPEGDPFGPDHRKIEAYYGYGVPSAYTYHGTHVSSVAIGEDPNHTDPNFRGMAYESRVVFQHYPTVITSTSLYDRLTIAHGHGAVVHNNSWGTDSTSDYIAWSRDIDVFTRANEDDLVVVAVTNANALVKVPENAKNCVAVAAAQDTPYQDSKCLGGYGPTADGRQKPEVWVPGCGSSAADYATQCSNVHSGGGTSYAAPAVTGMALLTRQYFTDGFYPSGTATPADAFVPSGALLKAVVINSAVDMTGMSGYFTPGEGWGRVLMDDALFFAGDARSLLVQDVRNSAGLSTGETSSYFFTVQGPGERLKVTLAWTDVPATLGTAYTPVNNLDLVVTDPLGLAYLGNEFSGVESVPGGSADAVNNTEQVHRSNPAPGVWQVDVAATVVNEEKQGYALVITGDVVEGVTCLKGDVNADGLVDGADIGGFVSVLLNGGTRHQQCAADMDGVDGPTIDDLDEFVAALLD